MKKFAISIIFISMLMFLASCKSDPPTEPEWNLIFNADMDVMNNGNISLTINDCYLDYDDLDWHLIDKLNITIASNNPNSTISTHKKDGKINYYITNSSKENMQITIRVKGALLEIPERKWICRIVSERGFKVEYLGSGAILSGGDYTLDTDNSELIYAK